MQRLLNICFVACLAAACGSEGNLADCEGGQESIPCSERTSEEDARIALDNGDYETAIPILQNLVATEPAVYERYPLLAAALAARAGVQITSIATASISGGGEGGDGDFISQMTGTLPDPADYGDDAVYVGKVETMQQAVDALVAIPAALRATTSAERYASSARFQLTLYQAAYSVMYLNQFTVNAVTGNLDEAKLNDMTEAEAITFLQSLASAASSQAEGEDAEVAAQIDALLEDIDSQEGAGNKEKLVEYLTQDQEEKA